MNSRPALFAAAVALVLALAPSSALAQSGDAYIEGMFIDTTLGQPAPEGLSIGFNFWAMDGSGAGAWGATLDENGGYRIGPIPPGTYKIQFVNNDFVFEGLGCPCFAIDGQESAFVGWWEDSADRQSATPVEVTPGTTTMLDFLVRLAGVSNEPGGWIGGTAVNAATGLPVPEGFRIGITLFDLDGAGVWSSVDWLDAEGHYHMGPISPGRYKVQFGDSSWFAWEGIGCPCLGIDRAPTQFISWWPAAADFAGAGEVMVALNETTTVDFLLNQVDVIPGGYIEGRLVLQDTGEPLVDWVVVEAYDTSGTFVLDMAVPSDGEGRYQLGPLPAGGYKLKFLDARLTGILTEWWPDQPDFASAESIEVLPGLATENIDFSLSRGTAADGGSITGTVIDAERDMPLPQINWSLYDLDGNLVVPGDRTDSSGRFRVTGLEPGSYKLAFGDTAYFAYEPAWYGGVSFESATVLDVTEGAEVAGINVALVLKPGAVAPLLPFGGLDAPRYLIASILLISMGSTLLRLAPASSTTNDGSPGHAHPTGLRAEGSVHSSRQA